jgi:hypothetical protein
MHCPLGGEINWVDPAGYLVARCDLPRQWPRDLTIYDFELNVASSTVRGAPYLPHV